MLRSLAVSCLVLTSLVACEEVVLEDGAAPRAVEEKPVERIVLSDADRVSFNSVKRRMEPVMEAECRARTRAQNCNYLILVDDRADQKPNAFQFENRNGQPIIAFTASLIELARNEHELALVMGHEGAHHIEGHLDRQLSSARAGGILSAGLATLVGGDKEALEKAYETGVQVGARIYSKEFELEADELGTILAIKSGYDPLIGLKFFDKIPDPGNKYLGSHPPHSKRLKKIRDTARNS